MTDLERLAQQHEDSLREVLAANEDLEIRLGSLSIDVLFDRGEDTLYVTLGGPQEAITECIRNHLYLRLDPDSLKLVGLEIPHVSRCLQDDPLLTSFLRRLFPIAISQPASTLQLTGELRELVHASRS